ncbi:MAG: hypothetical protein DKM50_11815 [Candidatus Margulisiibacteriota bacterium]|nr:MAG: hypothetical protein DKM50_11815 [Candidatus Margulisiibacteriota bacterium]
MKKPSLIISMLFTISMMFVVSLPIIGNAAEVISPELVKKKVNEAVKLLEKKGPAAYAELRDLKGKFIFAQGEGYIWVQSFEGKMVMHPLKPALEGKELFDMRDPAGNVIFKDFYEMVNKNGEGWVPYTWPKNGEKAGSPKISYCKMVTMDGEKFLVASGLYDVSPAQIRKKFPKDKVMVRNKK